MNCNEALSKIQPFIDDKLSLRDTEKFLKHIYSCKDCYEELEVCYMVITASKRLEEDNADSYNLSQLLSEKLQDTEQRIWKLELFRSIRLWSFIGAIGFAVFAIIKFIWG